MKPEESPPQAETHTLETMELRATGQVCWVAGACLPRTCEQVDHPYREPITCEQVDRPYGSLGTEAGLVSHSQDCRGNMQARMANYSSMREELRWWMGLCGGFQCQDSACQSGVTMLGGLSSQSGLGLWYRRAILLEHKFMCPQSSKRILVSKLEFSDSLIPFW